MTDNGSAYLGQEFAAAVVAAGLKLQRTRPHTPRTNGKAERFIQTRLAGAHCQRPRMCGRVLTAAWV
jgi:transposase InsO family protein